MPLSFTWADATSELRSMPTTGHKIFMDTPSLDPPYNYPPEKFPGGLFFTLRLAIS